MKRLLIKESWMSVKPRPMQLQYANAFLALASPGLALRLSSSPRPPGGIDVCFVYPLVTGDLWSTERISPQVTVDHRAKAGPGFANSFVFEEILLWCLSNAALELIILNLHPMSTAG